MAASDFVKMKSARWIKPTADGVEYGYGVLSNAWLNLRHNHSEQVDQNAIITHYPKEYVEYYFGNPRELKNAGENIAKSLEPILKNLIELQKELDKLKPVKPGDKVDVPPKTDVGIASKDMKIMVTGVELAAAAAIIQVAWEILKGIMGFVGDMMNQSFKEHTNPDGSLTMIMADYYHGSASNLRHVGLFGIINHVGSVQEMKAKIKAMESEMQTNKVSTQAALKRVTLNGLKPAPKRAPKRKG